MCAINIVDWGHLLKTKSTGSSEYVANPFLATVQTVWNTAMTPSVGVPQGKIVVGDTNMGLSLLWREAANIRSSDADQDDFLRNRLTVLCECRAALAVGFHEAFRGRAGQLSLAQ